VLEERVAEGAALAGIRQGVLIGRARNADGLSGDDGAGALQRLQRGRPGDVLVVACWVESLVELVLTAEQVVGRNATALEPELAGIGRPQAQLGQAADRDQAGCALRYDEGRLSAMPEVRVHGAHDDVHVGDPTVAEEHLVPVEDPVEAVATGGRGQRGDVRPPGRFGDRERTQLDVAWAAEAFRGPLHQLLGSAGSGQSGERQTGDGQLQRDAGASPEQLLVREQPVQTGGVLEPRGPEVQAVQAPSGGLLEDPHRRGPVAVVLGSNGAYDLLGEGVPLGELALLLGGQGQVQHGFSGEVSAVGGGD